MKPKTFSTSEICQICNLSRKKLRYYEEKGLLKDILRDDNNNYRRYTTKDINNISVSYTHLDVYKRQLQTCY